MVSSGSRIFPLAFIAELNEGFRGMSMLSIVASFLLGLQFNSCFPPSLKQSFGRRGKTSCFILAALLLKDLEHSLSHLLTARSPSSRLLPSLPSLPFSSPQVLSNLTPGEKWKVCGSSVSCVFLRVFLQS